MAEWTIPLSPKKFSAWLTENTRAANVVGRGKVGYACPLARYLIDEYEQDGRPVDYIAVDDELIYIEFRDGDTAKRKVTGWARYFVRTIDEQHPRGGAVTAGEAYRVLDDSATSHNGMHWPTWRGWH